MTDETRAKFLGAIADKVGADRIEEAHLFQPIRQGGTESGVAVVAVRIAGYDLQEAPLPEVASEAEGLVRADPDTTPPHGDPLAAEIPRVSSGEPSTREPTSVDPTSAAGNRPSTRLTIYTAKYRLTIKGPERGKWEFAIQAEADAPLVTVDAVVRGVQRRFGDVDEPAKLSGDEVRALLSGATA